MDSGPRGATFPCLEGTACVTGSGACNVNVKCTRVPVSRQIPIVPFAGFHFEWHDSRTADMATVPARSGRGSTGIGRVAHVHGVAAAAALSECRRRSQWTANGARYPGRGGRASARALVPGTGVVAFVDLRCPLSVPRFLLAAGRAMRSHTGRGRDGRGQRVRTRGRDTDTVRDDGRHSDR